MGPLVSLIIPVYNVEKYLQQCLDSVIKQTYQHLEIIVIDDGSTDGSGSICDKYAAMDGRVYVYHTGNQGLSAARNYGLDCCKGDYIGFLDSDDWMDEQTIELLLDSIVTESADVAVCGHYIEWKNYRRRESIISFPKVSLGDEIIREYLHGYGIGVQVWNKLYCARLFELIRFPEGRNFEDIAVTYKLLDISNKLIRVDKPLIHYRMRKSSVGKKRSLQNLTDCWISRHERYCALIDRFQDCKTELISSCMAAIGKFWIWYYGCDDKNTNHPIIKEMQSFSREHKKTIMTTKEFSLMIRFICLVSLHANRFTFSTLYHINVLLRNMNLKEMFE